MKVPELSESSATSRLETHAEPSGEREAQVESYHAAFAANSEKLRVTA